MRQLIAGLLASAYVVLASQNVFSVHDDLLAFPQYELIISDKFISVSDAERIIQQVSSPVQDAQETTSLESHSAAQNAPPPSFPHTFDPSKETYELMILNDEQHLCTIPIVNLPARNETSEKLAKAAEAKELTRATDRGWELLEGMEGRCIYYHSGWWSYSYCYNDAITQFHQLPPQPGKSQVPERDMSTKQFILGRVEGRTKAEKGDEWGNEVAIPKGKQSHEPPKTELQVKGDTRYLVQRMEGGSICDLTGKPRKIEIQFHCNPHVDDRIGYIKEMTTCSYQMLVYTSRLCSDVAFLPPKVEKANQIECRIVVDDDEVAYRTELAAIEAGLEASATEKPIVIGGVVLGAGKWVNKEGQRMPVPPNFGKQNPLEGMVVAQSKSKEEGGEVEMLSDKELQKLDLDPEEMEALKEHVQGLAKDKGWKIEVVDRPGEERAVFAVVDIDGDEEEDEGSEEIIYKDEL